MERLTRDLMGIACNYFSTYFHISHVSVETMHLVRFRVRFTYEIQFDDLVLLFLFEFALIICRSCVYVIKLLTERSYYTFARRRKLKLKGLNDSIE